MPRSRVLPAALLTVTAALTVAATAPSAGADTVPVSQSRGFFLAGTVGGTDLGTFATLQDAVAVNTGGPTVVAPANPLSATVLKSITVPVPGGVKIPLGVPVGAVNQYAQASPDGSALASSGAVSSTGAIQTSTDPGALAADASLDLQALAAGSGLPAAQIAALGNIKISAGALAGQANRAAFDPTGALGQPSGQYQIGSLTVDVSAPSALTELLAGLRTQLTTLLGGVSAGLPANPVLSVPIPSVDDVITQLTTVSGPGFSADLQKGTLSFNLVELLAAGGTNINKLPPNTDLVPLIAKALPGVATAITTALAAKGDAITAALGNTTITILGVTTKLSVFLSGIAPLPSFSDLATTFSAGVGTLTTNLGSGLGDLGTALQRLLQLVANGQSTAADGTFTETALSARLLPSGGTSVPTALQLDLGNASVGPGAPLATTTAPPTAGQTPVSQPPMLANTGPFETLGSLAIGAWAVVAGVALMVGAGAVRRSRLLHVGNHRH